MGFPDGSDGKESTYNANAGGLGWIPGLGRSPGGGNGNPLKYSCLKNSMDRGTWQATVHGAAKSLTPLNMIHFLNKGSYHKMTYNILCNVRQRYIVQVRM